MIVVYDSNTGVGNDLQNHWAIEPRPSRRNWKSPVFSLLEMLVLGKFLGLPNALSRNILG